MNKIETILLVASPEMKHTPAFHRAVDLARQSKAKLYLCMFVFDNMIDRTADLVSPEVMRLAREQFESQRLSWLTAETARLGSEGLIAECDVLWSQHAYEGIVAKCLALNPDIVLLDAGKTEGRRKHLSPAVRNVLRYCPAPVWLVAGTEAQVAPGILAAVDTSSEAGAGRQLNDCILQSALALGLYTNAGVHVAHVFPFEKRTLVTNRKLRSLYTTVCEEDERRFGEFAQAHQVPADRRHMGEGEPVSKIIRIGERVGAGILVVGNSYKTGFDRMLMGSVSESLADRASCDLVLVKPEAFSQELQQRLDLEAICRRHGMQWKVSATALPVAA